MRLRIDRECAKGSLRLIAEDEHGSLLLLQYINLNAKGIWRFVPLSWQLRYEIWRIKIEARIIMEARGGFE